jgi:ATP-dependent helicase/nuclease subunit A
VIDLQSNFRSRKPLLDAVNEVFGRLMRRDAVEIEYDQSQRLAAGATFPKDQANCFTGSPIELHVLPTKLEVEDEGHEHDPDELDTERSQREGLLVARRIEELMGGHGKPRMKVAERSSLRPIEYRDIVILLRATKFHSDDYAGILRQRNIPVFNDNGGGFFDAMEIRDILSLLKLLDNQRQDIPLAAVLRSPLVGLAEAEDCLARIRLAYPPVVAPVAFHEAAVRYAREQDDELAARLRDFFNDLERWRTLARQEPIAQLIWTIYEQTGYLAFVSGLHDGAQRAANLVFLYEKARSFGNFSRQGLYRFNQYLESLKEEVNAAQSPQLGEAENAVRIMSIHRAKGLEFPVVIVPEMGKRINFQSCQGNILADRKMGLGMTAIDRARRIRYSSLASVMVADRIRRQTLAEEMRILVCGDDAGEGAFNFEWVVFGGCARGVAERAYRTCGATFGELDSFRENNSRLDRPGLGDAGRHKCVHRAGAAFIDGGSRLAGEFRSHPAASEGGGESGAAQAAGAAAAGKWRCEECD